MKHVIFGAFALMLSWSHVAMAELKVVASFSILADIVSEVGGDDIALTSIVGPDADAHLYMPNVGDAIAVEQADLIFVNGLGFETWSNDLIANSGTKAKIVTVTEKIEPLLVEGEIDPHAWNALPNGIKYVDAVINGLAAMDGANAAAYQARGDAYKDKLMALDKKARDAFNALPEDGRVVVTAHDAFGYLADAYGLTFLAPVGIDTEAEPSAKELAALITHLKDVEAKALFVENIANGDLIAQIASETGIEISGKIYSDALSVKGSPATSYLAMFDHNLTTLIAALSEK